MGGVTFVTVPAVSNPIKGLFKPTDTSVITYTVRRGPLEINVSERGNLESSMNQDVYCNVEGQTTIIKIFPEGTKVQKGDVVCELDSASLKDQHINQKITTKSAEANFMNAKLTREVAQIAVREYKEGIFVQDEATAEGEIKLAESDLARAEDRVDWAQRMFEKGYVSVAQKVSEDLALQKARFSKEQAQSKLNVLRQYTKGKTIKELESDVEKAMSDELAKQATWALEKTKEEKLERQIAQCVLKAPSDGLVVYANDASRSFGSNAPQIEEGATVRERQKIFSLPDISKMQVNTKVHESQIDKIAPGMKAKIRVESFADQTLNGTVIDVAPLPDPSNFFSSDIKVYTTKVKIDDPLSGLRPGMSAQVEILVDRRPDVLNIPVVSVLQYHGKNHVTKKLGDTYKSVEVELGPSNDKYVQINKGLEEGDVVVMNPIALMSEEEKREAFRSGGGAPKKAWGSETPGAPTKGEGAPGSVAGGPDAAKGAPGAAAKGGADPAKAKAKAKGKGGRGGAMSGIFAKISPEDRAKMKTASPEERAEILKKAGATDEMIEQMKNFGGGGGGGRGGAGGGGGRNRAGGGGGDE